MRNFMFIFLKPALEFWNTLNSIGYILIRNGRLNKSIKGFELNVKEIQIPQILSIAWVNVISSLGNSKSQRNII
ncbi:hypothetical protein QE390_003464 [Siphonobacter sp. SORGH_AS 1065]|nr:hypothetical protein [Siphonobacter sp. SORGH_AS_1065]